MNGVGWLIAVQIALIVVVMMEAVAIRRTLRSQTDQTLRQIGQLILEFQTLQATLIRVMETTPASMTTTILAGARGKDAIDD